MAENMQLQNSPQMLFPDRSPTDQKSMWHWKRWFSKDDSVLQESKAQDSDDRPNLTRRLSRKAIPSLPRPGTFKRQQSELRDKLEPIKQRPVERRALSVDRRPQAQTEELSSSVITALPRLSAPVLGRGSNSPGHEYETKGFLRQAQVEEVDKSYETLEESTAPPASIDENQSESALALDDELFEELEKRWILNLSMHFRDRSNREKFFVTFAETPSCWRRVTISLDYRNAPPGSLEEELQRIQFQRDKSARIYESIRESLPDIQFYDSVTNLKLQTENERLHVHVTEDIHEVIRYPPVTAIGHLNCPRIREDRLTFDSHLSGFVYKVKLNGLVLIKKEIPGPDTVEEFLYEINALHRLSGSNSVIQFGGVVIDVEGKVLKGLLISYAQQGALIDVIFDGKGGLTWFRRERWARQIVQGLSEIHEAGFVQGDFTLSNIVIDADDRAKIIDINRRGCPVGWEPPEVAALIESKQRISMYIGVKSDIFQLGMVLWAIAMEQDEPEIQPRPLTLTEAPAEIPDYYRTLVGICLSDDPRDRCHTAALMSMFPDIDDTSGEPLDSNRSTPNRVEEEQDSGSGFAAIKDGPGAAHLSKLPSTDSVGSAASGRTDAHLYGLTDDRDPVSQRGRSPATGMGGTEIQDDSRVEWRRSIEKGEDKQAIEPRVVTISAARYLHMKERPEDPRTTEAVQSSFPGDLVGVGEHSTLEQSHIPQGIEDDDLELR